MNRNFRSICRIVHSLSAVATAFLVGALGSR
jgi:hypothetical protein